MNKKKMLLPLLGVVCLTEIAVLANVESTPVKAYDSSVWDSANELDDIDDDSYFGSTWSFTDIGSKRLDDRAVIVTDHADWGRRGQILKREFDITSFYIEFDCSQLASKTALMLAIGPEGVYASESSKLISMDIVRGEADSTAYICTLCTAFGNGGHATSIPSYTDGGTWADDANFTGVQCIASDGIIRLSFHKDNDITTTVKLNDVSTVVQNSELYANCVDSTKGHLSIGLINNAGPTQKYIIREFGDADTDVYYSDEGYFGKTKKECNEIINLNIDDYTVEQILALKDRFDAIPYEKMYSYDRNWLSSIYNQAKEKVNNLIASAGEAVTLKIFENKVDAIASTYASVDELNAGLTAYGEAGKAKAAIFEENLDAAQKTRYDAAVASLNTAYQTILAAMQTKYDDAITAYETAVNGTIDSSDTYLNCTNLKTAIPTNYNEYLDETVTTGYATRIAAADAALEAKGKVSYTNWEQGKNAHVVATSSGVDLITAGEAYGEKADSSGFYCTQALNVLDFDVVLDFSSFGGAPTGAWVTIGLMQNSGMWINADNDSIQDNRGVFFLISKLNSQTLNVQCFICTLTCNTFYDSVLTQTIQIPYATEMKVSFTAVEKTIAGVTDTYYNIAFGDKSFDEEVIKTRTLKTVFGSSLKGYFFIASAGIPTSNPAVVKIGKINGKDLSEADLSKASTTEDVPPTTTTTDPAAFEIGSTGTVAFNFDAKEKTITSVKVDNKAISAGDYTYADNTLTLTNDYLATLTAGSHTIEANTSAGKCTWTINVSEKQEEPEEEKGCGGSVAGLASLILSLLSIAGICLFAKKKEN